jgi:alkanesulfonate monooxygenase SsuD/methylene tetrahydromethanopterin reductase-like flavin-dependent oxidoreductase (luciferase family)
MVALRTGSPLEPQLLIEEAEERPVAPEHRPLLESMRERWVIGEPKAAAERIRDLAEEHRVDEVMVHPVAGSARGGAAAAAPYREETLRLLAEAI